MAAPRFHLLADLELPLRALSEALSSVMTAFHRLSAIHKGTNLEDSINGLSRALTSAMATPYRPCPANLTFQHSSVQTPYWCRIDSTADTRPLSRAERVQAKLAELKRASSPSDPLCFKCGDRGHLAARCYNATLCFICNHHGHCSSQCHAITETLPEPPIHPPHLTPPAAGSESAQQHPIGYAESHMVSLKSLETKLVELKQEMVSMETKRSEMEMAMAGIDAQILNSQSKLAEIEASKVARQRSVIRAVKKGEDEIGIDISSNKDKNQADSDIVPAKRVNGDVRTEDQGSWVSQVVRTRIKNAKCDSRDLNTVTLCREKRSVRFKRVAKKGTEKEETAQLMPMKVELFDEDLSSTTTCHGPDKNMQNPRLKLGFLLK